MLCASISYVTGGNYSLTSTSNDRFLRNFSWQVYLFTGFLPEIFFIFHFFFFDDWPGIETQAFASNKTTHYILDHSDFISTLLLYFPVYNYLNVPTFPYGIHFGCIDSKYVFSVSFFTSQGLHIGLEIDPCSKTRVLLCSVKCRLQCWNYFLIVCYIT